ncbi:MAG: LssY C-terminal domain-containing protein [Halioglobus sp.]
MYKDSIGGEPVPEDKVIRIGILLLSMLFLSACASRPYHGGELDAASFLTRAITQEDNNLVVHAAVPTAQESKALTGLDLYAQGIQPIWLKVENRGESRARVATWSIDRDYFSPIEVAYMNRKKFSNAAYDDLQRWFYENSLTRYIPAGESRSGLVFTHLNTGTKGFNLDIFSNQSANNFTFFVPMPGFTADFMQVDFASLYAKEQLRNLSIDELEVVIEQEMPCCASDATGTLPGGPLNVVLVGSGLSVRRSMLRGAWRETAAGDAAGELISQRARKQHFEGRPPDAIFTLSRPDGNEKVYLHLWLAPWRVEGEAVWVGQVYYWTESDSPLDGIIAADRIDDTNFKSFFARESVIADLDSAQRYLFQDLWYKGSLRKVGFVNGVGKSSMDDPRISFSGTAYFTAGLRVVVFLSEAPRGLDEGELIYMFRESMTAEETSP